MNKNQLKAVKYLIPILLLIVIVYFSLKYGIETFTSTSTSTSTSNIINDQFPKRYFKIIDRISNKCLTINGNDNHLSLQDNTDMNDDDQLFIGNDDNQLISKKDNYKGQKGEFIITLNAKVKHDGVPLIIKKNNPNNISKLEKWKVNKYGHIYNLENNGFLSYTTDLLACINHNTPQNWYLQITNSTSTNNNSTSTSTSTNKCTCQNIDTECPIHPEINTNKKNLDDSNKMNDKMIFNPIIIDLLKCKNEFKKSSKKAFETYRLHNSDTIENFTCQNTNDDEYDIKNHKDYNKLLEKLMPKDECLLKKGVGIENHPDYNKYMSMYAVRDPSVAYPIKYMLIDDYNKYIVSLMHKREIHLKNKIKQLENIIIGLKNPDNKDFITDCKKHFIDD